MSPDVLIARHNNGYRVLHGHLRLATMLQMGNEALVHASGEGKVRVVKTHRGILVGEGGQRLPLLKN